MESLVATLHGRSTPELDGMEMDEELTEEEIQLKREEREDAGGLKNLKNLRNGPRKISNCVERSHDDWWFS